MSAWKGCIHLGHAWRWTVAGRYRCGRCNAVMSPGKKP